MILALVSNSCCFSLERPVIYVYIFSRLGMPCQPFYTVEADAALDHMDLKSEFGYYLYSSCRKIGFVMI